MKTVIETTELIAPGDVRVLHSVIRKKATEWAVLDSDPRVNDGNVVNALAATKLEMCKFIANG